MVPYALEVLLRDSGLRDYAELPAEMPEQQRLVEALTRVQKRYDERSENERGLSPIESIRSLGRLYTGHTAMAAQTTDGELLRRLPRLAPLFPLSPALWAVQCICDGMSAFLEGRYARSRKLYLDLLARLESTESLGLDEALHRSMRLGVLYLIAMMEAAFGIPTAYARVNEHALDSAYRVNALRMRAVFAMTQGDEKHARECQRRAELAQFQDGERQTYADSVARLEVGPHIHSENLLGVKDCMERLQRMAPKYPRVRTLADVARAHYERIKGNPAGALEALSWVLETTRPAEHVDWAWVVSTHVYALLALGRAKEDADHGLRYLEITRREELASTHRTFEIPLIEALAADGRTKLAAEIADQGIAEVEAAGITGLRRGVYYEARAKVAAAMGDAEGFERWASACKRSYRVAESPVLAAKYQRLMQLAERWSGGTRDVTVDPAASHAQAEQSSVLSALRARMSGHTAVSDRGRQALPILLAHAGAAAGCICGMRDGELQVLAAEPETVATRELLERPRRWFELEQAAFATVTIDGPVPSHDTDDYSGPRDQPVLLERSGQGEQVLVGIAAVMDYSEKMRAPDPTIMEALARSLEESDEIDVVTRLD